MSKIKGKNVSIIFLKKKTNVRTISSKRSWAEMAGMKLKVRIQCRRPVDLKASGIDLDIEQHDIV